MNTSTNGSIAVSRSWQQAGFEIFAIVFSVLLALFVSEWWQDQKQQANHTRVLELVLAELEANRQELLESVEYYTKMGDALSPIIAAEEFSNQALANIEGCCSINWNGTSRTAHETATLTGLYSHLDPQISAAIVAPYVGHDGLSVMQEASLNGMMATGSKDNAERMWIYFLFVKMMGPAEQELMDLFDTAIVAAKAELEN